jgi:hypothetical protein
MITKEMLLSFCDDLSNWMVELGDTDLSQAAPHMKIPLRDHLFTDNVEEEWETLIYLTFWMCVKHHKKAPDHIESRIILLGKGRWSSLYSIYVRNQPISSNIWDLAG